MVGAPGGRWFGPMFGPLPRMVAALVLSRFTAQKLVMILTQRSKEDLTMVRDFMADGKVTPVIDKCYGLSEVPEAIRYLEAGHARGKVVISVE